jgi:hypothetical protein
MRLFLCEISKTPHGDMFVRKCISHPHLHLHLTWAMSMHTHITKPVQLQLRRDAPAAGYLELGLYPLYLCPLGLRYLQSAILILTEPLGASAALCFCCAHRALATRWPDVGRSAQGGEWPIGAQKGSQSCSPYVFSERRSDLVGA